MQILFTTAFIAHCIATKIVHNIGHGFEGHQLLLQLQTQYFQGRIQGWAQGASAPTFVRGFFVFCKRVGWYFELCCLNIFSLINMVNKKRICVRSLHFQSHMNKAPRMHAVNIRLKQTGFDHFSWRQFYRFCREVACALAAIASVPANIIKCYLLLWPQPHLWFIKYFSITG